MRYVSMVTKTFLKVLNMEIGIQKGSPSLDLHYHTICGLLTHDLRETDSHLVTFRTRVNATKTDYFLTRLIDKGSFLNSKVRVILDVRLQARPKVKRTKDIKWCRLKEDNAKVFAEKVIKEADWKMTSNVEDT